MLQLDQVSIIIEILHRNISWTHPTRFRACDLLCQGLGEHWRTSGNMTRTLQRVQMCEMKLTM